MRMYSDHQPAAIEAVGNGNWLYRYDIAQETVSDIEPAPTDDDPDATREIVRTQWTAQEVVILGEATANKALAAVIADRYEPSREQKLVNDYNAAQLGLTTGDEADRAVAAYSAFLNFRAAIKAQVDADFAQ